MNQPIHLHQIYYLSSQLSELDPAFLPYNNTANENREFAEYHVFEKEYAAGKIATDSLTSYVSWKFGQKTRIAGKNFIDFIAANPGYDVYFINPFPMQMKFFRNLWLQGEYYHPGILELSQQIFHNAGKNVDLATQTHNAKTALYCNYWVGTKGFWDAYMNYIRPIVEVLRTGLDEEQKKRLHSIADRGNNFSFIAFILERVFTTFINDRQDIRYLAYRHSFADIHRKYGIFGASLYKLWPDNSRVLNFLYTLFKRKHQKIPLPFP